MIKKKGVLCVFTKTPVPGQVKTRLIPTLGETKTTELYENLLIRTLKTACSSSISQVRLYCTPTMEHLVLLDCAFNFDIQLRLQEGADLGERMCNALNDGLNEYDYALVLGCDCPMLLTEDLELAYSKLLTKTEVVLGPAEDGGYYLLGLSSPQNHLFDRMNWGREAVLAETRRRLSVAKITWMELTEYPDLDVADDLPVLDKIKWGQIHLLTK